MIEASAAWKETHARFLLPETFVEIDCAVTESGLQEKATVTGENEAMFSDVDSVLGLSGTTTFAKYATLEHNLWALDGSRSILSDDAPYGNAGYVSNIAQSGSVSLSLSEANTSPLPGVTITWSSEYDEYPVVFTVTAKRGGTAVAETTIIDNSSSKTLVDLNIENCDGVDVTVHNWCLPDHRARIDKVILGHMVTFTKEDIISFTHTQTGSVFCAEIPKNSIEFSVVNMDNQWSLFNPVGMGRYLAERQRLTVRYGMAVGGSTEWIKAGTFYLSEWRTPPNGMEASFVARDMLEYMMNSEYTGPRTGTNHDIIAAAVAQAGLPADASVVIPASVYLCDLGEQAYKLAEVLQLCSHAEGCTMRITRNNELVLTPIKRLGIGDTAVIPAVLSYKYPEIELSKQLKDVIVEYGDGERLVMPIGDSGEEQTVKNPLIASHEQAEAAAYDAYYGLVRRQTVKGEYRADPRLDALDIVSVESNFGEIHPVVLTEIKYSYTGSFKASYVGRVFLPVEGIA